MSFHFEYAVSELASVRARRRLADDSILGIEIEEGFGNIAFILTLTQNAIVAELHHLLWRKVEAAGIERTQTSEKHIGGTMVSFKRAFEQKSSQCAKFHLQVFKDITVSSRDAAILAVLLRIFLGQVHITHLLAIVKVGIFHQGRISLFLVVELLDDRSAIFLHPFALILVVVVDAVKFLYKITNTKCEKPKGMGALTSTRTELRWSSHHATYLVNQVGHPVFKKELGWLANTDGDAHKGGRHLDSKS